jgi:hypothetical protein
MKNSIFVIKPYKWEGLWVFDDANVGLVKEPFVGGADTMIDVATAHIPNAEKGFQAVFSASYFPNGQIVFGSCPFSAYEEFRKTGAAAQERFG